MSNALAIAGVSAVIRDLLDNGIIDHQVTGVIGGDVMVSATAPDNIELTGANAGPRLNLFLHQVTLNAALRNVGFPSHDSDGARITNPPLALDLHYLLTAYGNGDLQAELLLGYAMQILHENPVLARASIRKALNPAPVNGGILPPTYQALRSADLAEQMEQIKITPTALNPEEMSRLWSALQAHYRPTVAYCASVVLIESSLPARSPLPVLTRGRIDPNIVPKPGEIIREPGVFVQPSIIPALPMLETVEFPNNQIVAQLGDLIKLTGHHLSGTKRAVLLMNDSFQVPQEVPAEAGNSDAFIEFKLPKKPSIFPVGIYSVSAKMLRPSEPGKPIETEPRITNQLSLVVAPRITTALPQTFNINADGSAKINLNCEPEVKLEQKASLILGDQEINAVPFTVKSTGTLTFQVPKIIVDAIKGKEQWVRLRVDGIESLIIDRSKMPEELPKFFDRKVTIK
jgi:hypothetical protein